MPKNLSDICKMVNHDCSPSPYPGVPGHRLQCKCSPFVSLDQRLTAPVISKPPYKVRTERAKPWPSPASSFPLFTQTLGTLSYGKSTGLSSQTPGISLLLNALQAVPTYFINYRPCQQAWLRFRQLSNGHSINRKKPHINMCGSIFQPAMKQSILLAHLHLYGYDPCDWFHVIV